MPELACADATRPLSNVQLDPSLSACATRPSTQVIASAARQERTREPARCSAAEQLIIARTKEGKYVPVRVRDLEAPEAIVNEGQLFHKRRAPLL